jgi:hypothetical protein
MDRPRPEYDAKGLPLGSFRLKPALDVTPNMDDNVFSTETGTEDDIYWTINPGFVLASEWSRHALELRGSMTRYEYQEHDSESRTDWTAAAVGRVDVLRGTVIDGEAGYAELHEPRYSANEPGLADEPTKFAQFHAAASIMHQPNRFGVQVGATYDNFRFDRTRLLGGGSFSNDDRDESRYGAFARVQYQFQPGAAVFLRGSYDEQNFDLDFDRSGLNRDSQRWRADLGASFFATRLIRGEIFAGYVQQRFESPLPDVDGFDYGAQLDWYVSPLMTVHLRAARVLNNTTLDGASVSDDQMASIGFDYELMRNVILHGGADFMRSKFRGTDRADELMGATLSVEYLINRYLAAHAGYRFLRRNSNVPGEDFDDNTFLAGLRFQI